MEGEKRRPGRPPGRKVGLALQAAGAAASEISKMDAVTAAMNEQQRLLFESMMAGNDELVSAIRSGHTDWFTGITKMVDCEDGSRIYTKSITLANVDNLTPESYERLRKICASKVRVMTGTDDYRAYTLPIREYIKRYAPMALGTIIDISQNSRKEDLRLKAAQDLLDRAGEREPEVEKDIMIPVQVNIMLTESDGRIIPYSTTG